MASPANQFKLPIFASIKPIRYNAFVQENLEGIHNLTELELRFKNCELATHFELINQGLRVERVLEKWQGELPEDWRIVKGSRVLDLGCGTALPDSYHVYPPYFCRFMTINGAQVFGVDQFAALPEDAAKFTHIQTNFVNLITDGRLKDLFNANVPSFDIIHISRVIDVMEPFFDESLYCMKLTSRQFLNLLLVQSNNLLLERGLLALENEFLRKQGAGFVEV